MALYCVKYANSVKDYYGFLRPWNGVRDMETYSLTYLIPSFINGIEEELCLEGRILRHKLVFDTNGMQEDFIKADVCKGLINPSVHTRHLLVNPEITFGFENKGDAETALRLPIYCGQMQYPLYADPNHGVVEMDEEEFDSLPGVETFQSDEEEGIYVGNNRQRGNEPMYITIKRNAWGNAYQG